MAYPTEIKKIVDSIPKEHHNSIKKIIGFYYELGVSDVQNLIVGVIKIPPSKVQDYGVYNNDEIDGG